MRKLAVWVVLGLFVWGLAAASQEGWIVWSSARAGDGKLNLWAIAPDGTKLVFNSDHDAEPKDVPDLWAMNVDGTGLVELMEGPPPPISTASGPLDGKWIVFAPQRGKLRLGADAGGRNRPQTAH